MPKAESVITGHPQTGLVSACLFSVALLAGIFCEHPVVAKDPQATPAAWNATQKEVATLVAACDYERAIQRLSEFIKANPDFAPGYESRAWATLDWLDFRDEVALIDYPLRHRGMHDPISGLGNIEPAIEARRVFLEDRFHANYSAPSELKSVQQDMAACRRLAGDSFSDRPMEAFIAEFVGNQGRVQELLSTPCREGTATAREYLTLSRVLRAEGNVRGAMASIDIAWKFPETRSPAGTRKANLLRATRKSQELMAFLETWRELSPRDPRLAFVRCSNPADQEAIFTELQAFSGLLPKDPGVHFGLATREIQYHKDAEAAMKELNRAIDLNAKSLLPYYARSCLWNKREDTPSALADATTAIDLGPYFNASYQLRAKIHRKRNDLEAARDDERRDLWLKSLYELHSKYKANPENLNAGLALSRQYARGNDWKPAEVILSDCLRLEPKNVDVLRERSLVYLATGKLDPALADATALVAIAPESGNYSLRGDVYAKRQEWDKAVPDYERAKCLDDRLGQALRRRAEWHRSKGRIEQARADQERANQVSQASFTDP